MLDLDKLKQDILQLIHDGCVAKLSQPVEYTAENVAAIYTELKKQVCRAVDSGSIVVSLVNRIIYLAELDEYLNMLPLIPMLYSEMLHNTYTVVGSSGRILGTVEYGGAVDENLLTTTFGVDTEFTFAEPIKTIQVEVDIS